MRPVKRRLVRATLALTTIVAVLVAAFAVYFAGVLIFDPPYWPYGEGYTLLDRLNGVPFPPPDSFLPEIMFFLGAALVCLLIAVYAWKVQRRYRKSVNRIAPAAESR